MKFIFVVLSVVAMFSASSFASPNCGEGSLRTYNPGDFITIQRGDALPSLEPGLTWEYSHVEEGGGGQTYRVAGRRTAHPGFQPGDRVYKIGDTKFVRDDSDLPQLAPGLTWEYSHTEEGGGSVYKVVARR